MYVYVILSFHHFKNKQLNEMYYKRDQLYHPIHTDSLDQFVQAKASKSRTTARFVHQSGKWYIMKEL